MSQKAQDKKRAKDARKAKDAPADFPSKPSTGTAMDAAGDKSFAWLSDAQRVKPGTGAAYTDRSSQTRRTPSTASAERTFEAMFPGAMNIKVR